MRFCKLGHRSNPGSSLDVAIVRGPCLGNWWSSGRTASKNRYPKQSEGATVSGAVFRCSISDAIPQMPVAVLAERADAVACRFAGASPAEVSRIFGAIRRSSEHRGRVLFAGRG